MCGSWKLLRRFKMKPSPEAAVVTIGGRGRCSWQRVKVKDLVELWAKWLRERADELRPETIDELRARLQALEARDPTVRLSWPTPSTAWGMSAKASTVGSRSTSTVEIPSASSSLGF
jgi:hypothetical protein